MADFAWMVWLIMGIVLMLVELMGGAFVLVALGLAAMLIAVVLAAGVDLSLSGQLLAFAGLAAVFTPIGIYIYRHRQQSGQASRLGAGLVGQAGVLEGKPVVVLGGDNGPVIQVRGDDFPVAFEDGDRPTPGASVEILRFEGITAIVRPLDDPD